MISTVTSKGQVTIPKEIRLFLNIKPSDKIDFSVENDQVVIKPLKTLKNFRGSVPSNGKGNIEDERKHAKNLISKKIVETLE
jgi:antitoxin PrlF